MNNHVFFYIWYGMALGLLWLPPATLLLAVASLAHARLRPYAATVWFVSLGAALGGWWSMAPAMFAILGEPGWVLLFHHALGVFPAAILQATSGIISGAAAGWWLACRLAQSRPAAPVWRTYFLLWISAVALVVSYVPPAGFEDWLGGGSGYGEGVPRMFIRFFETIYFPVFHWMFATGIKINIPVTYTPVAFSVTGPLVIVIWITLRIPKKVRAWASITKAKGTSV